MLMLALKNGDYIVGYVEKMAFVMKPLIKTRFSCAVFIKLELEIGFNSCCILHWFIKYFIKNYSVSLRTNVPNLPAVNNKGKPCLCENLCTRPIIMLWSPPS